MVCAASCYYTENLRDNSLISGHYHDNCSFGDTLLFTMDCTINDNEAEMFFTKRHYALKDSTDVQVLDKVYHVRHDTLIALSEEYRYSAEGFKQMLTIKNQIKRDSSTFKFSPNMYCTWKFFDEIYAAVAEW